MENSELVPLDTQRLKHDLESRLSGYKFELSYLRSCQSTNIECMRKARHGNVVIAEQQTAGRGRRGRNWVSPTGENIYCSIGLNKSISAEYIGMISLQVGVCITQVLIAQGYKDVSLKWPNDILVKGKKLGGILIETRVLSADLFYLVIGFGLNIDLPSSVLQQIDRPAISLRQVAEEDINRQQLLSQLIGGIYDSVSALQVDTIPLLIQQFTQLDSYVGKPVVVHCGNDEINGLYMGLEKTGQIKIETDHGVKIFSAADISLREARYAVNR